MLRSRSLRIRHVADRENRDHRGWIGVTQRVALGIKRGIDLTGATVGLVVISPLLAGAAIAVAVKMGRPVLFRQERPGLHGRPFKIVKFRTMRPTMADEVFFATDEQRVTPLGRFLRSSSIDELPELWNVLRGDMSLVGPRPLLIEYLDTYSADEARRHDMRPGFTSWAAVNGRHTLRFEERLQLDTWYVDNWSLLLDFRIIAMTIAQVLRRKDVDSVQDLDAVGFRLPDVVDPAPSSGTDAVHDGEGHPESALGSGSHRND